VGQPVEDQLHALGRSLRLELGAIEVADFAHEKLDEPVRASREGGDVRLGRQPKDHPAVGPRRRSLGYHKPFALQACEMAPDGHGRQVESPSESADTMATVPLQEGEDFALRAHLLSVRPANPGHSQYRYDELKTATFVKKKLRLSRKA
jgi:hypothetical protein